MADSFTLDTLDIRILDTLQKNADLTNQDLAQQVHVSAATCLRRVKRLQKLGFIEKTVAILAPDRCGYPLTGIVQVTLDAQTADVVAYFEQKACAQPEVTQCYRVSSGADLVLIVVLKDMQAYHQLAHALFTRANRVRNVRCLFATHRAKFETSIPLSS